VNVFRKKIQKMVRAIFCQDYWRAFSLQVFPACGHEALLSQVKPLTVLDIGANRGQFALVARHCCPEARIYAFEPIHDAQMVFRKVFDDDRRVQLFPIALGSQGGESILHMSKREDSSSLLPIGHAQEQHFPGTYEVAQLEIKVQRLDEALCPQELQAPVLCKIDVQGYELEVIRGMGAMLQHIQWIILEASWQELYIGQPLFDDALREMHQRGFRLRRIYDPEMKRDGELVQANCLFENTLPSHVAHRSPT
jgi:FkbM family methyltransferase